MFGPPGLGSRPFTALFADPAATEEYLCALDDCVEAARINDCYPAAAALRSSLRAMMPGVHRGLHPTLEIDVRTGLPTYREYVRISSDLDQAPRELAELRAWTGREGHEIYERLAARRAYYKELLSGGPLLREARRIAFRKVDPASSMAMFRVVLDRLDSGGLLHRLTVELSQRDSLWGRRSLRLDDNDAVHMSECLLGLVYRLASQDVEAVFLRLDEDPALLVDVVTKGTVGPFLFDGVVPKGRYAPLASLDGGGALFTVSLAVADRRQKQDALNDPLCPTPTFSVAAREELFRAIKAEPYFALTDRKFVLCDADPRPLCRYLEDAGTTNIVREL